MEVLEREVYTVGEVARLLGVSAPHIYRAINKGELPGGMKIGRRYIISKSKFDKYLEDPQSVN